MSEYKLEGITVVVHFRQLVSIEYNLDYVASCFYPFQPA